jgi:DNA-binding IclR family transcriptional regulator
VTHPSWHVPPTPADCPSILAKAFDLLRAFNAQERVMTLSEISRSSGLPKSTVHRLLPRLIEFGAIEVHRNGYMLGLGLLELGVTTPAGHMRDLALPHLTELHARTGLTVRLAVLRQFDVVYLEKLSSRPGRDDGPRIGSRYPAHCTAIGKVLLARESLTELRVLLPRQLARMTSRTVTDADELLAQLRVIRDVGVGTEFEEARPGIACTAAPVTVNGYAVGAISLAYSPETALPTSLVHALRSTATAVARDVSRSVADGRLHWFPRELDDHAGANVPRRPVRQVV